MYLHEHKNALLIVGMCAVMLGIAVMVLFYRAPRVPATAEHLVFSVLAEGTNGPIVTPTNYVINNESDFRQMWQALYGPGHPAPSIDFSQDQVLAVFAGSEPTGGYSVAISQIADSALGRAVYITTFAPDSACATGSSSAPYEIIAVPQTPLPLTHQYQSVTLPCD